MVRGFGKWIWLVFFITILVLLIIYGCATPNRGECPAPYKHTQLRNEGKVVLWCVP